METQAAGGGDAGGGASGCEGEQSTQAEWKTGNVLAAEWENLENVWRLQLLHSSSIRIYYIYPNGPSKGGLLED